MTCELCNEPSSDENNYGYCGSCWFSILEQREAEKAWFDREAKRNNMTTGAFLKATGFKSDYDWVE